MSIEITLKKFLHWLEVQMRNLDHVNYEELSETVVCHLSNQTLAREETIIQKRPERPHGNERFYSGEREGNQHFRPSQQEHQYHGSFCLRPDQGSGVNTHHCQSHKPHQMFPLWVGKDTSRTVGSNKIVQTFVAPPMSCLTFQSGLNPSKLTANLWGPYLVPVVLRTWNISVALKDRIA